MKNSFLILAVLGAVVPYAFFIEFFMEHGIVLTTFLSGLFVNGAAGGFTADLLISSFAFWLFLYTQKAPRLWLYIGLNLTIGLSCALPLYFYYKMADQEASDVLV